MHECTGSMRGMISSASEAHTSDISYEIHSCKPRSIDEPASCRVTVEKNGEIFFDNLIFGEDVLQAIELATQVLRKLVGLEYSSAKSSS